MSRFPFQYTIVTIPRFSNNTQRKGTRLLDGPKIELLDVAKQYVLLYRNLTNQSTLKNDNLNTQSLQFCPSLTEHTKKGQNFSMGQNSNFQTSQAVLLAIPQPYKPRNTKKWPASINNRTVLSFSNSTDQKGTRLLDGPKLALPDLARQYVL